MNLNIEKYLYQQRGRRIERKLQLHTSSTGYWAISWVSKAGKKQVGQIAQPTPRKAPDYVEIAVTHAYSQIIHDPIASKTAKHSTSTSVHRQ